MPSLPSATVLVLNFNGRAHLARCLPSLEALDYPDVRVMVIDNGSTDDSLAYVARQHRGVRVLALGTNRGFAPAYNLAIRQADTDIVVLLNNDTRVAATWLRALVDTLQRHDAAAAASLMLDWEGRHVDFAGGLPTFAGHAWQVDHGAAAGRTYVERPLLFGCGGALALRRDAFLDAGGFDDDYFAYFEDVDLGWRMNLAGYTTVLAPQAIAYHRLHGTADQWGLTLRLRLYERNALYTIYKNYGDEALARVLPVAVALTLARAFADAGLDCAAVNFGSRHARELPLPPRMVATLLALEEFARRLPALRERRAAVQARRRVSDEQLFALFPEPLKLHEAGTAYQELARALIRDFRIAELFDGPRRHATPAPPVDHSTGSTAAAADQPAAATSAAASVRRGLVSIIVLTASGGRHLPECLDSLRQHRWPAADTEVVVVDNGSADNPADIVARHYPGARLVRTGRNLGFSGGNNAGAAAASGEWLVFLNDDTRVTPGWLDEMMEVARRRSAAAVGALLVDWSGQRVDFAGGLVNFEGRGFSQGYDLPIADADLTERPLLFACGAAALFRRDIFEASGGWDTPTFAYYEDVEFGWRLWLLGHEVWFAPKAVVHHRHHGTSGDEHPARARAFERNALRMLYALLDDAALARVLPAALLLATDRALLGTPFSRADDRVTGGYSWRTVCGRLQPRAVTMRLRHALSRRGARRQYGLVANLRRVGWRGLAASAADVARDLRDGWTGPGERDRYLIERSAPHRGLEAVAHAMPAEVVAKLCGMADFLGMLPALSRRRAWLQARRQRTDAEIFRRFGDCWLAPVPSPRLDLHVELRTRVIEALLGVSPPVADRGSAF